MKYYGPSERPQRAFILCSTKKRTQKEQTLTPAGVQGTEAELLCQFSNAHSWPQILSPLLIKTKPQQLILRKRKKSMTGLLSPQSLFPAAAFFLPSISKEVNCGVQFEWKGNKGVKRK